jgi:hypothetical protein
MKRVFSNPFTALAVGLCLRLFFVLKFPAGSGDTVIYEQIAANWLKHGAYAIDVAGQATPVDLRMPGYPAFLAIIYELTGRTGEAARLWVMLAQVAVDLLTCVLIALLAVLLVPSTASERSIKRIFTTSLWLAVLSPFTANYTAVPLTEVLALSFTTCAFIFLVLQVQSGAGISLGRVRDLSMEYKGAIAGFIVGLGTLVRPETPLLLIAAVMVISGILLREGNWQQWIRTVAFMGIACLMPLVPWAVRNALTLHEFQPLAPKSTMLPGELDPQGFIAWEKTWLYRVRDCYLVPWKLNEESINLGDLPATAFDTPEEKQRVAAILEQYNEDLTLTAEEDAAFARLARERRARHPLRSYLWLPARRAVRIWFTPRIELLPFSGHVFPLGEAWEDDPVDQSVTLGFFLLNIIYIVLAVGGALRLWRRPLARPAVALLVLFILLRTAFLTTLETPEPRYVLVCYPAILALAAQVFSPRAEAQ